ncbi:hypothetical protein HQ346_22945, partial [Rhodococcus sp. BP-252]|nr:hypothetical protein [Rhodococcus sp. BP-252]
MKILVAAALTLAFLGAVFTGVFLVTRQSDAGGPAPAPITAPAVPSAPVRPPADPSSAPPPP